MFLEEAVVTKPLLISNCIGQTTCSQLNFLNCDIGNAIFKLFRK